MSSTTEPVSCRTLFYERTIKEGRETFRFLPFYLVNVIGGESGKMFEPRDIYMDRQGPDSVVRGIKPVHKIQEFNGNAKLFMCETDPKQVLHSFSACSWPET